MFVKGASVVQGDMLAYAAYLESSTRHPKLLRLIRLAVSVASAAQDLDAAQAALQLLRDKSGVLLPRGERSDRQEAALLSALVTHAVILYARATETETTDRLRWFGRSSLPVEMRQHHIDVMAVRDRVIAHFGKGAGSPDGAAVFDAFVLNVEEGGRTHHLSYHDNRAITNSRLLSKLQTLVDWAHEAVHVAFAARDRELNVELKRVATFDNGVARLFNDFPFDAEAFYGRFGMSAAEDLQSRLHIVKGYSVVSE